MSWKEYYEARKADVNDAIKLIKSNSTVVVSHAVCEPTYLIDAMVDNKDMFENVEIVHMIGMGKQRYCEKGMEKHFNYNSIFVGGIARNAIYEGRGDFTTSHFSQIPDLFYSEYIPVDTMLVEITPPDKHGYCSLGLSVDYGKAALSKAKQVIAQVNDQLPRTHGDSFVHVTDIDVFVEHSAPIIELKPGALSEEDIAIGKICAEFVNDGDTLQLGIGSLPDAVLANLRDKNDLGIHSEMISDGVLDLIESGNINNKKKTLHKGRSIVSFIMGTRRLYDYCDDNPALWMMPVDYVNDPYVIAQNDNLISINSCIQVDLTGQVCSESVGLKQISASGGQVDFVRGARLSKGGKSIIATHSTAAGGKISKIVPFLDKGATVTTLRNDVEYVVTEYGYAYLRGKTLRERARALIEIAHPKFRDELKEEWERRFHDKYTK